MVEQMQIRIMEFNNYSEQLQTYFEHLTVLVEPPLDIESIVPKKETFSVPQFGQGP